MAVYVRSEKIHAREIKELIVLERINSVERDVL